MIAVIQGIFVLVASLVIALLVAVGVLPDQVLAPEYQPPALIEQQTASSTPQNTQESPDTAPEQTEENPPLITDYEQSLQSALDALAALKNQDASTTEPISNLNETVRGALVNILCTTAGSGPLNPISASGVIIDPRGVILTNAHVAQYFLLKDYSSPDFITCIARTGSPAKPAYNLELLFISPSWIADNAQKIDDETPKGNGEHDYALLRITGFIAAPDKGAPSQFPHLSVALDAPKVGDAMLVAGYPAGFLGGAIIQKELYAASANATVQELYTFDTTTPDLFSIGGSVVAQQGSSGGAVARQDGALVGLITTSSQGETTGDRDLRALSTEYIIRSFESERGISLANYLGRNLSIEHDLFMSSTAPLLTAQLIGVLEK